MCYRSIRWTADPSPARGEGTLSAARAAVEALDWPALEADLDAFGCAVAPKLLPAEVCPRVAAMYEDGSRFRSTVVMARHGFGRGEYKYFADPLPGLIVELRQGLYRRLAPSPTAGTP